MGGKYIKFVGIHSKEALVIHLFIHNSIHHLVLKTSNLLTF